MFSGIDSNANAYELIQILVVFPGSFFNEINGSQRLINHGQIEPN